ncbi:hypothetical protein QTG54_000693 [Skeletonema marinoi]|uniref:Uncharacterized protein n=1 Tax=Skeletonema marinoi TaxID=267567 RepID=A0AAD9DJS7_9STRA|nr:hypothetical protein QTG54_000693 [Skeletonema marinoi]|mmetsp:Transcript_7652/g.12993  ORF Transcript_7652/g.12993 Transcript_7652/m.12993 type:complete len:437 (+) Transcript_7652:58-1368(+)
MNSRGPPGRGRGGGRGYGRGRGYYSGGGRYNNHRGRGDYGGRGGRYIPRGGGGRAPRMGSYSSIGRGGGDGRDHGNHLDRNRDNDSNANSRGVGSYADLASSIPSYSDIGRSIGGGNGGPMQNNNNNRDDVGMSSYAQLGEMSQPPPSLGMKRGRPLEDRPPQMMGSNNYGADDMGPRGGGGGPPPSYRGHNNRDDGMARGPQPPHNDYRQPPENMQDKRSSLPHQPPPPDDKFGGRRGPDWGGRSDSHEDQFGRQLPPKRTSSGYGRGPPVRGHPRFVPDANRADTIMQRPESLSPPPRRENSYHRFDGQRSSHDASMPSYASIADKPIPQPVEERPTQQHDNTKKDDAVVEVKRDEAKVAESKRRSSTPPPPVETPVVVVPPSPKSPSPAPPSAYALAVSRMVEMNADMEFAWVRMQMIDTEVKIIEARLESME